MLCVIRASDNDKDNNYAVEEVDDQDPYFRRDRRRRFGEDDAAGGGECDVTGVFCDGKQSIDFCDCLILAFHARNYEFKFISIRNKIEIFHLFLNLYIMENEFCFYLKNPLSDVKNPASDVKNHLQK